MKISNHYRIENRLGAFIYLDQDEVDQLIMELTFVPRPWTKEEVAALDKDTKVEISTEESRDGCAKDDYCTCAVCLRNHI